MPTEVSTQPDDLSFATEANFFFFLFLVWRKRFICQLVVREISVIPPQIVFQLVEPR